MANGRLRKEIREMARGLDELGAIDAKAMREFKTFRFEKSTPASEPKPRKRARRSRVVMAPEPTGSCAFAPNRVLSVVLREGEDVRWIWTSSPEGQYVSGYTIVRSQRRPKRIG